MKALPLLLFSLLAASSPAQTPTPTPGASTGPDKLQIFRATLPGGTYEVAVRSMVAVTTHEYLVDGAARVTEVNIDTYGSLLARFYFLEPATPNTPLGIGAGTVEQAQQLLQGAAEKSGQEVWKKVVKNYPTTTHARTVEYRLESKEQLMKVFASAEEAFRTQHEQRVKIE